MTGIATHLKKVLWITVAWTIVSLANYIIGMGAIIDANYIWDAGYDIEKIDFLQGFFVSAITGLLAGILGGSAVVFFWENYLRTKSYGWTLRSILLTYLMLFNIVSIPVVLINNTYNQEFGIMSAQAWAEVREAYSSPSLLIPFFFWMVVILTTFIVFQISDKYGPGVFAKFLLGKYFNASREERVFMFLDLKSSTTIAEQLGEERYFDFLKESFKTITPAILKNRGEIYQYVGDEIVISWPKKVGVRNDNCINAYFQSQTLINNRSDYFQEQFGIVPNFKAGLHQGFVMAGEMGVVKREIAYSGDVLNTASRIQSKCNELDSSILISGDLANNLSLAQYSVDTKGRIDLRGKANAMELVSIRTI
ncbi:MAG: adenylate/guanylate cyclase domain-containing protein [Ekhidna sp.]|nr:adenylate/guanylate cyclase domain-containing protein [Ekhidna sp.]